MFVVIENNYNIENNYCISQYFYHSLPLSLCSPFVPLSLTHSFFHLLSSYFSFLSFTLFSQLFQNILLSNSYNNCCLILVYFSIFKQIYQVSFSFIVLLRSIVQETASLVIKNIIKLLLIVCECYFSFCSYVKRS